MTGVITKVKRVKSHYWPGNCWLICFREKDTNKAYRTWISSTHSNYQRWAPQIKKGVGTILSGLSTINKSLVNAGSCIKCEGFMPLEEKQTTEPTLF